ncbi:MAG: hypothetical protein KJ941_08810 [Bacteroidetes bacterium]|nr:hypothetical protein [Bacteroidota bacterium]
MKFLLLAASLIFLTSHLEAQTTKDLKKKTLFNYKERKEVLQLLKNEIKKDLQFEIKLNVRHLKVSNNYAWFEGDVRRKDGKVIDFQDDFKDCCHVEGLLLNNKGTWEFLEFGAFSTDCWFCGIANQYPNVPNSIFSPESARVNE